MAQTWPKTTDGRRRLAEPREGRIIWAALRGMHGGGGGDDIGGGGVDDYKLDGHRRRRASLASSGGRTRENHVEKSGKIR